MLGAFLLFAGAGSYLSARRGAGASITGPVIAIAVIDTTCALISPWLTGALIGTPPAVKVAVAFALIAPLATLMGMPFPRALARLNTVDPLLLPWAWGINGCASVHRGGACDPARHPLGPYGGDARGSTWWPLPPSAGWRPDTRRRSRALRCAWNDTSQ